MEVNKSMGKSTNLFKDRKVIRCSFLKDILEEFVWKKNESFIAKVDHTRDFDFKSIYYLYFSLQTAFWIEYMQNMVELNVIRQNWKEFQ